jgi:RNA polymerase sigma-70 factor (ECF subfamily)
MDRTGRGARWAVVCLERTRMSAIATAVFNDCDPPSVRLRYGDLAPPEEQSVSLEQFRGRLIESLPHLRGFARSYCGSAADADDAVQITCEHALARWQQWNGQGTLEHWLVKILVNSWRDERRSRKVRAGPDIDTIPEPGDDSDYTEGVYLEQVNAEIQRLPDGQREVLLLVASEGLSYQETAAALGIPVGTVMSRLCRARQTLIGKFGNQNG